MMAIETLFKCPPSGKCLTLLNSDALSKSHACTHHLRITIFAAYESFSYASYATAEKMEN